MTSCWSPRPGRARPAYALTVAAELLARREVATLTVVTPTEHLKHQWAQAAQPVRHRHRLRLQQRPGPGGRRLRRRGRHLRAGRGAPGAAPPAHREPPDAGRLRRDPPRGRRAVLGRRGQGGVRPGPAPARADRHAVPQRRQPHPVRQLRRRTGRRQAQRLGLRVRLRAGAGGRRGAPGHLPGLLRRDALAHPGRGRDHRHARHADDQGPDRAGLADRARPGGGVGQPGAGRRRQAADRGAPRDARRGRPGHRGRSRRRAGLRRRCCAG